MPDYKLYFWSFVLGESAPAGLCRIALAHCSNIKSGCMKGTNLRVTGTALCVWGTSPGSLLRLGNQETKFLFAFKGKIEF